MTSAPLLADTRPHPSRYPLERRSGVRLGSVPADSEQDLRFLQERMALFAKTTFLISLSFLVATTLADAIHEVKKYQLAGRAWHTAGTVIALVYWLSMRSRRDFAPSTLQAVDVAATLGICWSFSAMGHHAAQPYGFYTGMLALTHVTVSRAMIVPSVPWRSLLLGAAGFAGMVVSRGVMPLSPELVRLVGTRGRGVLEAVLWSMAGAAVSTVASKVIYGLQERAREARQLGQYTLERKIGEGGMGEVYRARHAMLRRPTAVKLLAGNGSEQQLRRFEKEVQLTAQLTHPNTISIFDYGRTPDGIFYYAMELLDGLTLEELVQLHGRQPAARVIRILHQVCGALAEAHHVGLIHRDIKPANIFLCHRGDVPDFVKVLDFGLVRELKNDGETSRSLSGSNVNVVVGTPLFLSPEAILSPSRVDARADIYGLGCVGYYLLTGSTPFKGESVVELCAHHLHTVPEPPSARAPVGADLERVILSCLAKDPAARPESARALAAELERCRDARGWNEADARAWWEGQRGELAERRTPPGTARARGVAGSGEHTRRTICCADLQARCARREQTG